MKPLALVLVGVLCIGCTTAPPTVATPPQASTPVEQPKNSGVLIPHKLEPAKPVTGQAGSDNAAKPGGKTEPATKPSGKVDPAVIGTYKFQLSEAQRTQIVASIEKMKHDVAKGVKGAEAGLAMAQGAMELVDHLEVRLLSGGKFSADFGQGPKNGTFSMQGDKLVLLPNDRPTDPNMPQDVELTFDKKAGTLSANFQGELMTFKKVS